MGADGQLSLPVLCVCLLILWADSTLLAGWARCVVKTWKRCVNVSFGGCRLCLESTADVSVVLVILLGWLKCRSRGWLPGLRNWPGLIPEILLQKLPPAVLRVSRVFGGVWYDYLKIKHIYICVYMDRVNSLLTSRQVQYPP